MAMAGNSLLFKGGALRQLKRGATKSGGRNNLGRITAFHRGGGAKRSLRLIDMKRNTAGLVGTVERIEYDPFRTARTALIRWEDDTDADGEARPVALPPKRSVSRGEIQESNAKMVPRGIHQVPRRELRSAVATICGVSVLDVERNRRRVKVVTVDGRRKFSSSSFTNGVDQGIGVVLPQEEKQIMLETSKSCLKEACFGDYSVLLKKFAEIPKNREAL